MVPSWFKSTAGRNGAETREHVWDQLSRHPRLARRKYTNCTREVDCETTALEMTVGAMCERVDESRRRNPRSDDQHARIRDARAEQAEDGRERLWRHRRLEHDDARSQRQRAANGFERVRRDADHANAVVSTEGAGACRAGRAATSGHEDGDRRHESTITPSRP
jgi:hypothetical protein